MVQTETQKGIRQRKDALFIDFSKAYNQLDQIKLIQLIEKEQFNSNIKRYLKKAIEEQSIWISGSFYTIKKGVPQGSALSPFLFNLYAESVIKEIQEKTRAEVVTYADDMFMSGYLDFEKIEDILSNNGLNMNKKKCASF